MQQLPIHFPVLQCFNLSFIHFFHYFDVIPCAFNSLPPQIPTTYIPNAFWTTCDAMKPSRLANPPLMVLVIDTTRNIFTVGVW